MTSRAHAEVEVYLLKTDEGGRMTAAGNGYSPYFCIDDDHWYMGRWELHNKDYIRPGERSVVDIHILAHEPPDNWQEIVGTEVKFREGPKLVGTGRILTIREILGE